jgi:hypothetical protein
MATEKEKVNKCFDVLDLLRGLEASPVVWGFRDKYFTILPKTHFLIVIKPLDPDPY